MRMHTSSMRTHAGSTRTHVGLKTLTQKQQEQRTEQKLKTKNLTT